MIARNLVAESAQTRAAFSGFMVEWMRLHSPHASMSIWMLSESATPA